MFLIFHFLLAQPVEALTASQTASQIARKLLLKPRPQAAPLKLPESISLAVPLPEELFEESPPPEPTPAPARKRFAIFRPLTLQGMQEEATGSGGQPALDEFQAGACSLDDQVPPTPCGPPISWVIFTVQLGETLLILSQRYGVSE